MEKLHRFHPIHRVMGHIARGASLVRALFNESLRRYRVDGDVLDLGSKSAANPSYRYLNVAPDAHVTFTDIAGGTGVIKVNVEERLPFADDSFDYVLAFHLMEHVYQYGYALGEIRRVLRRGGKLIVAVPFLHMYHEDPVDYFRFTDTALIRMCQERGLECVSMEYIGEGLYSQALTLMARFQRPRVLSDLLQAALYCVGTLFDRAVDYFQRQRKGKEQKTIAKLHALEHLAVFRKAS
jgi:SAM-dependent methyltransferase